MEHASSIAQESEMLWQMGCAIVGKGRKLIAASCNYVVGTIPANSFNNVASCHAEMGAIEKMLRRYGLLAEARRRLSSSSFLKEEEEEEESTKTKSLVPQRQCWERGKERKVAVVVDNMRSCPPSKIVRVSHKPSGVVRARQAARASKAVHGMHAMDTRVS
jgi:hypothetical protein